MLDSGVVQAEGGQRSGDWLNLLSSGWSRLGFGPESLIVRSLAGLLPATPCLRLRTPTQTRNPNAVRLNTSPGGDPLFRRGPERGGLLVGRQPLELLEGVGGSAKAQLARPSIAVTSTKFVSDVVETRFP